MLSHWCSWGREIKCTKHKQALSSWTPFVDHMGPNWVQSQCWLNKHLRPAWDLQHIQKSSLWALYCPQQSSKTYFWTTFWGSLGPHWGLPQIWPDQVLPLCSAYDISQNQLSGPSSFWDISWHRTFLSCFLLYVGWKLGTQPNTWLNGDFSKNKISDPA